jgi:type II secretory pathway pseudopilin PulG
MRNVLSNFVKMSRTNQLAVGSWQLAEKNPRIDCQLPTANRQLIPAFTLIELMTVISIIVLVLALAVPVVSSLQGSRSVEAGYNKVSAALAHARQIALYYRSPAGVVFFQDPVSGRQQIGYVMQESVLAQNYASYATTTSASSTTDPHFIDLIPNEELVTFPQGVAVQVLNGNAQANGRILSDGTIQSTSLPINTSNPPIGYVDSFLRVGVVFFDEYGQLSPSTSYWIAPASPSVAKAIVPYPASILGQTLELTGAITNTTNTLYGGTDDGKTLSLYSSPAVCIYDEVAFTSQLSNANAGSSAAFNDGNNNLLVYGDLGAQSFQASTNWSADTYVYLNQQVFQPATGGPGFPGVGYLKTSSASEGSAKLFAIDQANEAQWLNTNGQLYVIKPNDGSLLKNQ